VLSGGDTISSSTGCDFVPYLQAFEFTAGLSAISDGVSIAYSGSFTSPFNAGSPITTTSQDIVFTAVFGSLNSITLPGGSSFSILTNVGNVLAIADQIGPAGSYQGAWASSNIYGGTVAVTFALKLGGAQQSGNLLNFTDSSNDILGAIDAHGSLITGSASNTDQAGTLSLSSATTASYTFASTSFLTHPVCSGAPDSDPGSGVRWYVTYTGTTAFTVHFTSAFTGNFDYVCIPRD
jgi:hypothetical protein